MHVTTDPITAAQHFHRDATAPHVRTLAVRDDDAHPWGLVAPASGALSPLPGHVHDGAADALALFTAAPAITTTPPSNVVAQQAWDSNGRQVWVYVEQPTTSLSADPPNVERRPLVSRWAADLSVVSLALAGASYVAALALHEFALATAVLVTTLESLAWWGLVAAFVFGLLRLVGPSKPGGRGGGVVKQEITNHVTARGMFARGNATSGGNTNT